MYTSACSGGNPVESSFTPCDVGFNFWQLPPRHPALIKFPRDFRKETQTGLFSFTWSEVLQERGRAWLWPQAGIWGLGVQSWMTCLPQH